ncbi:retrovirus-related pol polyprotein from transposon TNT 1-94 [Tanacetum coccineum]
MLNVGSTEGSCDQQALETDRIQLQDMITSLRIQLDGLKLSALTAENTKLKAQVTGKTSSGPSTSETPKVLAPGMYNLGSKYIPPPKRANWVKPTPTAFQCHIRNYRYGNPTQRFTDTNLYSITLNDMMSGINHSLLTKASSTKSWLWHRRLNHLNFGTLNELARNNLVRGLPMLKYDKDHLCPSCQLGKSKKTSHPLKAENTNTEVLHTLHMDLCGPMRTIKYQRKKYVLVILDDYTRFGWVRFLRTKDETPQVIEKFIVKTQRALNATVRFVRTDNGTEFVNKTLDGWFESVGISHETSVPRSPQQNGVVERRNRTLMEAARTMLIFAKAPLFLWAEALKGKKPNLYQYFSVFGSLCYPTNDYDDVGKLKAKADIDFSRSALLKDPEPPSVPPPKKQVLEELACHVPENRQEGSNNEDALPDHRDPTYAYVDVRAQNQDLLITIYELNNKLRTVDKGKIVNTKFDKYETSGTILYVTPLPKNIAIKAKKLSNYKVNPNRSKPVTSHPPPKNKQGQKQNENVLARGMYRIIKIETQTPDSKTNTNVSNSTGVESSNSVRRPTSKDTKSKNRVLKNTNAKNSTTHVWKMSRSLSIDSNNCETMNSTISHVNKSV